MSNYNKSFNFRNGVQVDDSNFIVNATGLVGIGTTVPQKKIRCSWKCTDRGWTRFK